MQIDDLMLRIRRLTPSKLQKLDEMLRSLETSTDTAVPTEANQQTEQRSALPPVRGLLRDLGPAPEDHTIRA